MVHCIRVERPVLKYSTVKCVSLLNSHLDEMSSLKLHLTELWVEDRESISTTTNSSETLGTYLLNPFVRIETGVLLSRLSVILASLLRIHELVGTADKFDNSEIERFIYSWIGGSMGSPRRPEHKLLFNSRAGQVLWQRIPVLQRNGALVPFRHVVYE